MNKSPESYNPKSEKPEIVTLAETYVARVKSELETGNSRSMRHILNNAVTGVQAIILFNEKFPHLVEESVDTVKSLMGKLDDYFDLLERYPVFKEGEKAGKLGYFADRGIKINPDNQSYREALEKEFGS